MADRFWVGGAGNWSSTTKWSTTSGGGSGASVPTSADDAIFDANSGGKFIATVDTAQSVNSLTITPSSSVGILTISLTADLTTGNLTTTGTAGNNRIFFTSTTYGIAKNFTVNGTVSISDCDFRGVYILGTAAPISGTRIGNRGECRGITFSTPKTVYWNLAGTQNWSANGWATTSTGTPSTDNFPLPQDTATFTNAGSVTGTILLDGAILYVSNVDMSGRTTAMTINFLNPNTCYGNWTNGSGTAFTGTQTLTFSGGTTQTITSAGKTFTCPITIDTYGGTVQLADALNIGVRALTVTNGTFNTAGYATIAGELVSGGTNVRAINFGASTITLAPNFSGTILNFAAFTNLNFNAGTSQLTLNTSLTVTFNGGGLPFYNVSFTGSGSPLTTINNSSTFNNLTFNASSTAGIRACVFSANQTINGTLTCAGATAVRRIFLQSSTIGTPRTLTVNAISADDCDFRDINLAGAASGASPTRAGDCGGNTGITFPAPKTVYWNLAGTQNWSATAWATGSGGTPNINNFPLAQDTAVFDNTGVAGTITIQTNWNIGTFDASLRTSAMTLTVDINNGPIILGDWKFGTGVTSTSNTATITFAKNGTQTITSNGVQFGCGVFFNNPLGNFQLADALSLNSLRTLTLNVGAFDAVTYNVTTGLFQNNTSTNTLRMGSGTWTLSGVGSVWAMNSSPILIVGTSTIVLSDTSTTARTFAGGGLYYNKLTIGGTTGTSTLTIAGNNTFGELASTKTVAHTIAFGTATATFGKWSVTGTAGNVVTITGTSTTNVIAGPAVTGVDYLAMGSWGISTTSPGEFYAGANSTGTAAAPVFRAAAPAPRTLYWVGGTGNWSSTTKWDTTSGGGGGAAIPTSLDAVNFNSLSNATAYTATIDAGVTLARCASFTMAGPASGNVTFAGSVGIAFHGNVSFAATGITRTYTGAMNWAGNSSYTFTTNGLTLNSTCTVIGVGSTWTLGSALNNSSNIVTVTYGAFNTSASNYALTAGVFQTTSSNIRSVTLSGSTLTLSGGTAFSISITTAANLTFSAGTSTISLTGSSPILNGGGQIFNNVSFTSAAGSGITINGANTFNTLSFAGRTSVGIAPVTFNNNQTITTLTLNAGTAAAYRTFLASDTIGTPRTLTVGTLTAGAADVDFRDITIAGAAAPISGTRFGDAKGNSGITFPAAKTVYWRQQFGSSWGTTGTGSWASTAGSGFDGTAFPLAQDTAVFTISYPNTTNTTTINANYNIGTIDMSARSSVTMNLATGTTNPQIYGNWINGTGITLSGTGQMTFAGRTTQQITSAGKTFTQPLIIHTPGGSIALQDAFVSSNASGLRVNVGTFDANTYAATVVSVNLFNALVGTTVNIGSGTWTLTGGSWQATTSTNLTITGTGTISLTSASPKQFSGGDKSYSDITLNQGGAGTLTFFNNNTLKNITNTYSATGATTIALGDTTQTLTNSWTATGEAGRVLTVSGTSAASPATLRFTGAGTAANVNYLAINNVRAYDLVDEWYAGPNSTNGGSLGWYFVAGPGNVYAVFITESASGVDAILAATAAVIYDSSVAETASGIDAVSALSTFGNLVLESASGVDAVSALAALSSAVAESASGADVTSALASLGSAISEAASGADNQTATATLLSSIAEAASAIDATAGGAVFTPIVLESASGIDTASSSLTAGGLVQEGATAVDAANSALTAVASVSESSTALDSLSTIMVSESSVIESAIAADATASLTIVVSAVDEATEVLDASAAQLTASSFVSEDGQASEIVATQFTASALANESGTAADSVSSAMTAESSISESANVADAASSSFTVGSAVNEAAQVADASAAQVTAQSSVAENARAADQAAAQQVGLAQIADTVQALDAQSAQFNAAASVAESARAADQAESVYVAQSQVAEAAVALDEASSSYVALSSVSEIANVQDTASAAFVAGSTVSESVQAQDTTSAVPTYLSITSETASPSDAVATSAVFFAQVFAGEGGTGTVTEATSTYPVGTSFTGSQFFNSSSAGNGVSVVANGTGTGTAGGFNAGGNYIRFGGTGTTGTRPLTTVPLDLASATSVTISAISGNNTNGGEVPDSGESLGLYYSLNGVAYTLVDLLMSPGNPSYPLSPTFSNFVEVLPPAAQTSSTYLQIRQASNSGPTFDTYGVRQITITYPGGGGSVGVSDSAQVSGTYNAPIADSVSAQDTALSSITAGGTVDESAQSQDAVTPDLQIFRSVQELAEGLDQTQASAVFLGAAQEFANTQDATATQLVFLSNADESARGQDQESAQVSFGSQVQEDATAQDSVARQLVVPRTVSEFAQTSEQVQTQATFLGSAQESSQAQDTVVRQLIVPRSVSETASAQDQQAAALSIGAQVQEDATAQDSVARQLIVPRTVSESVQAQDSVARQLIVPRSVSETASAQDQEAASLFFASQVQEDAATQDSIAGQLIIPRTASEFAQAAEQVQTKAVFRGATQETARVADELIAGGDFTAATTESAQISDQDSAGLTAESSVSEQVSMADAVVGVRVTFGVVVESAQASDQSSTTLIAGARIEEQANARDSVASTAVFISSIAELGRALDTSAGFIVMPASVAELAEAQDSDVGFITFPAVISEGATGTELAAVQATFRALISEQVAGQEVVDAPNSTYNVQVVQSIQVQDFLFLNGIYNAAVEEVLVVLDQASGTYLWNLINDDQNPNWGLVNSTQTVVWTAVGDNQTPNWQNVGNTQGTGWAQINTDDDPSWQPISPP
jgi:hypothetical protein